MQTRQEIFATQNIPTYLCELNTLINGETRTLHLLISAALIQDICQSTKGLLLTSPIGNHHDVAYTYTTKLTITLSAQFKHHCEAYITVDYFHELELDVTFFPTQLPILTTAHALPATASLSTQSAQKPHPAPPLVTSASPYLFKPPASRAPKQPQHHTKAPHQQSTRAHNASPSSYKSFLTPDFLATPTFVTVHHDISHIYITFNWDILKAEFKEPLIYLNYHITQYAANGLFNNCDRYIGNDKMILSFSKEFGYTIITQSVLELICALRSIPAYSSNIRDNKKIHYDKETVFQATRNDANREILHTLLKTKIKPLCPSVSIATCMDFLKSKLDFPNVPGQANAQQQTPALRK